MNIRYATTSDWPVIEKLNELYNYHNPEIFIKESIDDKKVIVSEDNGETTGYLLWQTLWGNTPFLALVKVLPEHQRKKHGTSLVREFEKIIKNEGFTNYISSSIDKNHEALAFHEALDYKSAGAIEMPYGEEIFYQKKI